MATMAHNSTIIILTISIGSLPGRWPALFQSWSIAWAQSPTMTFQNKSISSATFQGVLHSWPAEANVTALRDKLSDETSVFTTAARQLSCKSRTERRPWLTRAATCEIVKQSLSSHHIFITQAFPSWSACWWMTLLLLSIWSLRSFCKINFPPLQQLYDA